MADPRNHGHMTVRQKKITFGEMREAGVDRVLIYCADYKCSHSDEMYAGQWTDDVRVSDIEDRFVCTACGKRARISGRSSSRLRWARANEIHIRPLYSRPSRLQVDRARNTSRRRAERPHPWGR
jgi:hypothetical protein